jgi:hypothetical protein
MADAADSKSVARKGVWVQVPPLVLKLSLIFSAKKLFRHPGRKMLQIFRSAAETVFCIRQTAGLSFHNF